jgi:Protein of unknown function (DUF3326)
VLAGLSNAPQYVTHPGLFVNGCIVADDVDSVVLPADACGGSATLAFSKSKRPNKVLSILILSLSIYSLLCFFVLLWFY